MQRLRSFSAFILIVYSKHLSIVKVRPVANTCKRNMSSTGSTMYKSKYFSTFGKSLSTISPVSRRGPGRNLPRSSRRGRDRTVHLPGVPGGHHRGERARRRRRRLGPGHRGVVGDRRQRDFHDLRLRALLRDLTAVLHG